MNDRIRIAIFTVVEVTALVIWLALVRSVAGIYRVSIGSLVTGLAVLAVGITIEHVLAYNVINRRGLLDLRGAPVGKKAVVSVIETGIWALWLALADLNGIVAAVVLAVLLIVEHTLSDNVFKDRGIFSRLIDARTIGFSIIETAGAAIWLVLVEAGQAIVGIAILAVASFIEHLMAVALGRREAVRA